MPKYKPSGKSEFLNEDLNSKLRYNIFMREKSHLLQNIKDPNHRAFIFALYVKKFESIKKAFEENPNTDSFDDDDIDNVFLIELNENIANGKFQKIFAGYVRYKIENQCEREGREPPKFNS